MIVYILGMNTDIDAFWNLYAEKPKKRDVPDYMYLKTVSISTGKEFKDLWDTMQSEYDYQEVENNFFEFFSKYLKF